MVVGCPKCKVKLKVADEKIGPEGLKIKCPKCSTVLMVRKPVAAPSVPTAPVAAAAPKPAESPAAVPAPSGKLAPEAPQPIEAQAKELNLKKVLVAHENAVVVEEVMSQLMEQGFLVLPVPNGVDTLVQAMKELPFLLILDAALPKIDGFEIIKRLKEKEETRGIKTILISSKTDESRLRKNPASVYGVSAYIDDDDVSVSLTDTVAAVISGKAPAPEPKAAPTPPPAAPAPAPAPKPAPKAAPTTGPVAVQGPEKARRLARTVLSDIDLYDPEKVLESIRNGKFEAVFGEELREGLKHYQSRIPKEVRAQGNFFQESLDAFLAKKKEILGIKD